MVQMLFQDIQSFHDRLIPGVRATEFEIVQDLRKHRAVMGPIGAVQRSPDLSFVVGARFDLFDEGAEPWLGRHGEDYLLHRPLWLVDGGLRDLVQFRYLSGRLLLKRSFQAAVDLFLGPLAHLVDRFHQKVRQVVG